MKFSEFYPSPVPVHEKWSNFIAATLEQNFNALQKSITHIGQDLTSVLPKYLLLPAGATIAAGNLCVMNSSGSMVLVDADAVSTSSSLLGIAKTSIASGASGLFLINGLYVTSGLTAGDKLFVSTTAGTWQNTAPTGTGKTVRGVGYSISTTQLYFDPDRIWTVLP